MTDGSDDDLGGGRTPSHCQWKLPGEGNDCPRQRRRSLPTLRCARGLKVISAQASSQWGRVGSPATLQDLPASRVCAPPRLREEDEGGIPRAVWEGRRPAMESTDQKAGMLGRPPLEVCLFGWIFNGSHN